MKKALCMDFDGVFIDSTNECIKTALTAYKNIFSNKGINNTLVQRLKHIRPMVKGASEYLYAIKMVLDKKKHIDYSDFDSKNFKQFFPEECIDNFVKDFYKIRENFISKYKSEWINSHMFFNDAYKLLNNWNKKKGVDFFIISLKDKKSIEILIEAKEYNEEVKILDNQKIKSKTEALDLISKKILLKKKILYL